MKAYFTRRLLALLAVLILGGCATMGPPARPMPSVDEIVQLSQQGLTASEIIRRIDQSHAVYRLSASELANLRDRGVSDGVINHMNKTHIRAAGREAVDHSMWAGPPYWGYPYRPHPYLYDPWWP